MPKQKMRVRPSLVRLTAGDDLSFVRFADGGTAIGKEDDDERAGVVPAILIAKRQGFFQRLINRGAADGFQILDELFGFVAMAGVGGDEFVEQRFNFSREPHDFKAVAGVQILHAELQRLFGLIEFLAGHRPRGVEHEDNILGRDAFFLNIHARRRQQQEIAVVRTGLVRDEVDADSSFSGAKYKVKSVSGGRCYPRNPPWPGASRAV
jgi:hypothetical protein